MGCVPFSLGLLRGAAVVREEPSEPLFGDHPPIIMGPVVPSFSRF